MKIKHFYPLLIVFGLNGIISAQVGINTPTPQATLDIVGNGSDTSIKDGIMPPRVTKQQLASKAAGTYSSTQNGALIFVTDVIAPSGITPSLIQVANINSTGYYYFDGIQWVAATPAQLNIYNANGSLTGNRVVTQAGNTLAFTTTANNGFSVDGTGFSVDGAAHRVGIGTSTPDTRLHVVSSVASANRYNIIDATAGTNQYGIVALRNTSPLATGNFALLGFTNSGPTSGGGNWAIGSVRTGAAATNGGEEDFYIGNSTGGGLIERFRILPNTGFVGIGISTPTNRLHVNATNPLRLEGLQSSASATSGSLTVDNTGVVQVRNAASISAVKATGNISITVNNTFTNLGTATEAFDNLNEFTGTTFTAASAGLYKVDFLVNYPQRAATEDTADGYLGFVRVLQNGTQLSQRTSKVALPESGGAPSVITCSASELVKLSAGDTLTFQGLTFGSTPTAGAPITAGYTINIVRMD